MTVRDSLRDLKRRLAGYRIFPVLNFPNRAVSTWSNYVWPPVRAWIIWLFKSREDSNFTYALTQRCQINFIAGLSSILNQSPDLIKKYLGEIQDDAEFRSHFASLLPTHPDRYRTDLEPHIGRRMVWYAVVRATKPEIVVETGVDQGMGAVVLCAALKRNASEGHVGKYFGTDLNPRAGYFLKGEYAKFGKVLYGDSLKSLATLDKIDLFINDSDHSGDYEKAEYELVRNKLSVDAVVLGDNAHVTSELAEFSMRHGRRFIFLPEEPANHWYRGAGIGVSTPGISNPGA
ncbi:MAG: class I SAM-dependent methyltransferase [Pseudomonadota bacterium]